MARRLRCRVGDLAILVTCGKPINIGKIVTIESTARAARLRTRETIDLSRQDWFVRSVGAPFVYSDEPYLWNIRAFVPDAHLVPIRPNKPDARARRSVEELGAKGNPQSMNFARDEPAIAPLSQPD